MKDFFSGHAIEQLIQTCFVIVLRAAIGLCYSYIFVRPCLAWYIAISHFSYVWHECAFTLGEHFWVQLAFGNVPDTIK